jgi:hypothetical protein
MKIAYAADDGFYCIESICKVMTKYIRNLPDQERYKKDVEWFVHETQLPELFKRAKATGHHDTLLYDVAKPHVREKIDQALGKKRAISPSFQKATGAYSLLHLVDNAPLWIVEAAWKAFVRHQHPDVGGDAEHFIKVKSAYESLKERNNETVRGHSGS